MTRKEELLELARRVAYECMDVPTGEAEAQEIFKALQQVEREVWAKAAKIAETEGVYPELNCALGGPAWYQHGKCIAAKLRQQQEGL